MSSLYSDLSEENPRKLIPELCRQFYNLGWVTGTGGGISIRLELRTGHGRCNEMLFKWKMTNDPKCDCGNPHQTMEHLITDCPIYKYEGEMRDFSELNSDTLNCDEIYIAPSGVQKERILPEDLFIQTIHGEDILTPPEYKKLKKSQCTPLFMLAYRLYNAGAVIHTHSPKAVMVTLLWPGKEFRCTHLEMIKGIYNYRLQRYLRYDEELIVPIIENTPLEKDLEKEMNRTMDLYPGASAILVRRHGIYVWGDNWQKAKAQTECYDYLFSIAIEMRKCGFEPNENPNKVHKE